MNFIYMFCIKEFVVNDWTTKKLLTASASFPLNVIMYCRVHFAMTNTFFMYLSLGEKDEKLFLHITVSLVHCAVFDWKIPSLKYSLP